MATLTKKQNGSAPLVPTLMKTKAEHQRAVERVSALMTLDPPPRTAEGRELELLAHLAEKYEMEHHGSACRTR